MISNEKIPSGSWLRKPTNAQRAVARLHERGGEQLRLGLERARGVDVPRPEGVVAEHGPGAVRAEALDLPRALLLRAAGEDEHVLPVDDADLRHLDLAEAGGLGHRRLQLPGGEVGAARVGEHAVVEARRVGVAGGDQHVPAVAAGVGEHERVAPRRSASSSSAAARRTTSSSAPSGGCSRSGEIADFYRNAQWPDGNIDFSVYRTQITLEGDKLPGTRQETDTISRLVYGFATAYLMTGEDRFLEVAEKGTEYLRDHMRTVDAAEGIAYWVHGVDTAGGKEKKILASEFGDDYDAIPAYEQIYALAGPTQTFRVTGDPRIQQRHRADARALQPLLPRPRGRGFFSHIDPITFDPRSETLGDNQARKNWNSVGDHAPAFLINAWLATGDDQYADFLAHTADTIVSRFPDYEKSPFVNERFHEDWTPDHSYKLAAQPRGRRPQPEDRVEPDAHQQRPAEQQVRRAGEEDRGDHARRSAATGSAAAGTT